jgi:hypothetical protein
LKKKKKYISSLLGYDHPIPIVSVKKYCLVLVRNAELNNTLTNKIVGSPAWLDGPS